MRAAKLFTNGGSQAVRLPREYQFAGTEVIVTRIDNMVILLPKNDPWSAAIASLEQFSDDFMIDRNQPQQQERELFQ